MYMSTQKSTHTPTELLLTPDIIAEQEGMKNKEFTLPYHLWWNTYQDHRGGSKTVKGGNLPITEEIIESWEGVGSMRKGFRVIPP